MFGKRFCVFMGVLVVCIVGCKPNIPPAENVLLARQALIEKRWPDAIIHLKNTLRNTDESTTVLKSEIQLLMGKAYLGRGDMKQASRFLLQAIEGEYQLEHSIPAYARALFHEGEYSTLADFIASHQDNLPSIQVELALYEILVLHKTGKSVQASTKLSSLSDDVVNSIFGQFTQAYIQASKSPDNALALVDALISNDADYVDAYFLKGQLLFSQKRFVLAYQAFDQYLVLQPHAKHIHFLLAMSALQQSNTALVQQHVTFLREVSPNHPLANHLQALLYFDQKNFEQAKAFSEKSLQYGLKSPINELIAGLSCVNLKQDEQAYQYLVKAAAGMPSSQQVKKMLTLIQLKLGYLQDATESFESLTVTDDAGFSLGNMVAAQLLDNQQHADAQHILSKLQFVPVAEPMLKLKQGVLQLRSGDNQGLAIIAQVANDNENDTTANLAYIMALADAGNLAKALEKVKAWQQQNQKNIHAMNVLALMYQKNQQPENEALWYKKALSADNKNVPAILYHAYVAARKGKTNEAREYFTRVLSIVPNHSRAFSGLLRLTIQSGELINWDDIQSSVQFDKPHDKVLTVLVGVMYQQANYQALNDFLTVKTNKKTWSTAVWNLWLQAQIALNDKVMPEKAMQEYLNHSFDTEQYLFVISLLEKQQAYQRILEVIKRSGTQHQLKIEIKYAKANALLSLKKTEKAAFLISQLEKHQPLPSLVWLQGQLALLKGEIAQGKKLLEQYFVKHPTQPGLIQLSEWALADDDSHKVISLGEQYLVHFPNDIDARALLSNWVMRFDKPTAIAFIDVPQAQGVIIKNWKIANNLAWMYLQSDNKKRALTFSKHAYKQQPTNSQVLYTYAVSLLHHGEKAKALTVLHDIKSPNEEIQKLISGLSVKN